MSQLNKEDKNKIRHPIRIIKLRKRQKLEENIYDHVRFIFELYSLFNHYLPQFEGVKKTNSHILPIFF